MHRKKEAIHFKISWDPHGDPAAVVDTFTLVTWVSVFCFYKVNRANYIWNAQKKTTNTDVVVTSVREVNFLWELSIIYDRAITI